MCVAFYFNLSNFWKRTEQIYIFFIIFDPRRVYKTKMFSKILQLKNISPSAAEILICDFLSVCAWMPYTSYRNTFPNEGTL